MDSTRDAWPKDWLTNAPRNLRDEYERAITLTGAPLKAIDTAHDSNGCDLPSHFAIHWTTDKHEDLSKFWQLVDKFTQ